MCSLFVNVLGFGQYHTLTNPINNFIRYTVLLSKHQ
nr:MAG TPA_asm: hypothetical protein [Bacteriophage sp.]